MELRHLRYLIAIAEERSFSSAAARLRLAQPALSRQIRDLEREIGTPLFVRDSTGTVITAAGEQCAAAARQILDDVGEAIKRARLAHRGLVGKCVLGAGRYPLWNGLLGRIVEQARSDYPGIEVVVEEFSGETQWTALENAEIDIGIGSALPAEKNMRLSGATHSLDVLDTIVVARTHPLASRESVTLDDLESETYIRYEPAIEGEATQNLQSLLSRRGFAPAAQRSATNADSLRMLVRAGVGWSALPRSMRNVLNTGLVAIPIEDLFVPFRYVYMYRRGDTRPAVQSILTSIKRSAERDAARSYERANGPIDPIVVQPVPPRLELRHLRYFCAIVQYQSIGRAAEALELTQPALSRQLRSLESDVGVELLTRTARGIVPTLAGESLHHDSLAILAAADRLGSEAHRAVRGTAGNCVVGVVASSLAWDTTAKAVADCAQRLPFIDVRVEDVPTPKQAQALREARLDIAVGHRYPTAPDLDPSLNRELLLPDRMNMALVGNHHPLATRSEISLKDLSDVSFMFMKRSFSPALYDVVMGTFSRAGFVPRIDGEYDGLPTVWALAAQGLGWALGTASQKSAPPQGVTAVQITDFDIPWGLELAYRRVESRMPVLEMINALRRAAHEMQSGMGAPTNKYWSTAGGTV